jgi:hypothetical protein
MPRPLIQQRIGQLEEMFVKGKSDPKVLKLLEHELQHRQVPRAVALRAEVQAAMFGGAVAPQAPTVPAASPARRPIPISSHSDMWGRPAALPVVSPPASVRTVAPAAKPPEPSPTVKAPALPPTMLLEDACSILKTIPGATWESIEQARRALVQQSHPSRWKTLSSEKRAQALAETERVNAAYAALAQARCGVR